MDEPTQSERRIREWADLSGRSKPPAEVEAIVGAEAASPIRRAGATRPRRSEFGLALVLVAILAFAGTGFGLSRWLVTSPATGSPSASVAAARTVATPRPSATEPFIFTSPGQTVDSFARIDRNSAWALVYGDNQDTLEITHDGGATWRESNPPQTAIYPVVTFLDADHGWYMCDFPSRLWRTSDGGLTWKVTPLPAGRTAGTMSFVSPTTGYVLLGQELTAKTVNATWNLYRTGDGGATLDFVATVLPGDPIESLPSQTLAFSDESHGVMSGESGIFLTGDGGIHWSPASLPWPVSVTKPYLWRSPKYSFGPQLVLVTAATDVATSRSVEVVFTSPNAGATWQFASVRDVGNLLDVIDGRTWLSLVAGHGPTSRVEVTTDAGRTWTGSPVTLPAASYVASVSFVSATDGWADIEPILQCNGACPLRTPAGTLAQTHDGGKTWQLGRVVLVPAGGSSETVAP
jgi:photosystem II stability/assembly factor-like uncharacterized protein